MRVLSVSPYYEPEGGGLERYQHAILDRLAGRGHQTRALALTAHGLRSCRRGHVDVTRLAASRRFGNTPVRRGFRARILQEVESFGPDVVVAHTPVPYAAEMGYLAARKADVPFVATYHAGRLHGSSPALGAVAALDRWTLQRRMLRGAAGLIAVGPYVRDHALARHRDRVSIVPPGVDAHRFCPNGAAKPADILCVAPLDTSYRWKGVDVLWEAFFRLRPDFPDSTLTLVGQGNRLKEFRRLAAGLKGRVRLPGRLDEGELVDAYRQAAVVVLPSLTDAESFGMVLAEANACGRPVVGSRIGGIPDFVTHGANGLLARPGDPGDLARCLRAILADPDAAQAMGRRGREKVLREHDWDQLARQTEAALAQAAEPT